MSDTMRKILVGSACLLALAAAGSDQVSAARHRSDCASAIEVSALQTVVVQQELMDAALGCGDEAMHSFNAFQVAYAGELRRSDRTLLTMFKRIQGSSRGDAAYNLFKTNMASKAEIRRVHQINDFCNDAKMVFQAALAADKPSLADFVAGVQIQDADESPVGKCNIQVAVTLHGAMVAPNIVPKPNPLRLAAEQPASLTYPQDPPVALAPAPAQAPAQTTAEQKPVDKPKEEKKGFLSGLFGGGN